MSSVYTLYVFSQAIIGNNSVSIKIEEKQRIGRENPGFLREVLNMFESLALL